MDMVALEKGQSYEIIHDEDPVAEVHQVPEEEMTPVFDVDFLIKTPCDKVYTEEWQSRKAKTVKHKAREAGYTPDGEVQLVKITPEDQKSVRVTFSVICK